MIKRMLQGLAIAVFAVSSLQATPKETLKEFFGFGETQKPKTVRVLIARDVEGAMLQVSGGHNVFDPHTGDRLATRFTGKETFVQPIKEGLKWGEIFPKTFQIQLVPDNSNITVLVDGVQYKGTVTVYQAGNRLNIVNDVPVEDYIRSTLSDSLSTELTGEAMAALAIVARTDAYYLSEHGVSKLYDVVASEVGYQGEAVTHVSPALEDAVAATRNMVMRGTEGSAFAAQHTNHSAGHTAAYSLIYRRGESTTTRGVSSPFAATNRNSTQWSAAVSKQTLARVAGLDSVDVVKPLRDPASNKVYGLRLEDGRYSKTVDFLTLQEQIGKNLLKSSEFEVSLGENTVSFTGVGDGPGVGLCLYSAQKMAERGDNASTILQAFFPETSLVMAPHQPQVVPVERNIVRQSSVAERSTRNRPYRHGRGLPG